MPRRSRTREGAQEDRLGNDLSYTVGSERFAALTTDNGHHLAGGDDPPTGGVGEGGFVF